MRLSLGILLRRIVVTSSSPTAATATLVLLANGLLHKLLVLGETAVREGAGVLMMINVPSQYYGITPICLPCLHQIQKVPYL